MKSSKGKNKKAKIAIVTAVSLTLCIGAVLLALLIKDIADNSDDNKSGISLAKTEVKTDIPVQKVDELLEVKSIDSNEAYRLLEKIVLPDCYSLSYNVTYYSANNPDVCNSFISQIDVNGSSFEVSIIQSGELTKSYVCNSESVIISDALGNSTNADICENYTPSACACIPDISKIRSFIYSGEYDVSVLMYRNEKGNYYRISFANTYNSSLTEEVFLNIDSGFIESYVTTLDGVKIYEAIRTN